MQVGFAAFVWWGLILLVGGLCDFPTVWVRSLGLDSFAGHFRLGWVGAIVFAGGVWFDLLILGLGC